MIREGRWAYWPVDGPMLQTLKVYEGDWEHRREVGTITRYQAMAFYRHWDNGGVYFSVRDGNRRWVDVYVVGDTDAFYGDEVKATIEEAYDSTDYGDIELS